MRRRSLRRRRKPNPLSKAIERMAVRILAARWLARTLVRYAPLAGR